MPTLYVENVSTEIYESLRSRANSNGRSISAEVLELLAQNYPTGEELARRRQFYELARRIRANAPRQTVPFETVEEMLREDRNR